MRFPWKKREEKERELRIDAELRVTRVQKDWDSIRTHKAKIDHEIARNDWTATAILLFSGDNSRK